MGVATVQEEIGLRGAITSSYNVNPDAGFAIDVTFSTDHPDTNPKKMGEVKLGKGPVLHRGPNINPVMENELFKVAKAKKIAYQVTAEPRGTGTDANWFWKNNTNFREIAFYELGKPFSQQTEPVFVVQTAMFRI